ncbi:Hypothetical predicted protein [Paramuricea clavata]|uniref:Uncharacterized protein n=1 Tax=Paramuricea clavata TaxID=317549 RepID=A0A6S7FXB5_PARCT|nr:Hypothetical predicted protein [Paramuricea clavata]
MLRTGKGYLFFQKEIQAIKNLITATRNLIASQKEHYLEDPTYIYKRRKYSTPTSPTLSKSRPRDSASIFVKHTKAFLNIPEKITMDTLEEILDPLENEINLYEVPTERSYSWLDGNLKADLAAIRLVGAKVLKLWTREEVGETGWKKLVRKPICWYKETVLRYAEMTDTVEVEFETEKGVVYNYLVEKEVNANRLKLAKDTSRNIKDYEEIFQIGAFRSEFATETAVAFIVDSLLVNLDKNLINGMVLVDYKKAFDMVDHSILLHKLGAYHLNQSSLDLFKSYLSDRKHYVNFKGQSSTTKVITE